MAYNRTLQHFTSSQELATVWASGQDYIVDQLVLDNDKLYRCITAHTSGATFAGDSANWVGINPGDVIDIADGGTGQITQTAAFDALAPTTTAGDIIVHNGTDNVRQAIGSDGQVLVVDSAQTNKLKWATIQQGSKNYIPNATFENGVTPPSSWSTFSTTIDSTTKVPSGAITTPDATYTLAVSSSTPLAGTYSMAASTGGTVTVTTTGYGFITAPFTIDAQDKAKPMGFSFYYQAISGSMNFSGTSSNTFAVYIYAVDGTSGWIQPAGVYNLVQSSGAGICSGTFQTTSDSTQYRLAIIMINSVTGSLSMRFDDFQLGPQKVIAGAAVSDWVSYTPTVSTSSGSVTNATTTTSKWRRIGDSAHIKVSIVFSAASAAFSDVIVTLPSGLTIDTAKLPSTSLERVGSGSVVDSGANSFSATVLYQSTTQVIVYAQLASGTIVSLSSITNASPFTFGDSDYIDLEFIVPISGWSSNTVMSQDTDTRVVALYAKKTASVTGLSAGDYTVLFDSVTGDTSGSYTPSTGEYIVPVSGWYSVVAQVQYTHDASIRYYRTRVLVDGSVSQESYYYGSTSTYGADGTAIANYLAFFTAGQKITITAGSNSGSWSYNTISALPFTRFTVHRLSGPATIAASETVAMARSGSVVRSVPTAGAFLDFDNASGFTDTHGAWRAGSGYVAITGAWSVQPAYVVPVSGIYSVSVRILLGSTAGFKQLYIRRNGSTFASTADDNTYAGNFSLSMHGQIKCNAGDLLQVFFVPQNAQNAPSSISNFWTGIEISRVGN